MPLAGTICCQTGLPTPFDDCWERCRNRTCVYPLPLIDSMRGNGDRRANAGFSATMVSQCPLQTVLKEEYDYYESPSDYHARWRGEGVHKMAEVHGTYEGIIQERRLRKSVSILGRDFVVSGQPDWWDVANAHLDDWKSTKRCPVTPYDDHVRQVNIYAWLIDGGVWDDTGEISDGHVETAAIVYIDPERSVSVPVELWSSDATEQMIIRKLEPYVRYMTDGIRPAGIGSNGADSWKRKFCPFRGTGHCCGDKE